MELLRYFVSCSLQPAINLGAVSRTFGVIDVKDCIWLFTIGIKRNIPAARIAEIKR